MSIHELDVLTRLEITLCRRCRRASPLFSISALLSASRMRPGHGSKGETFLGEFEGVDLPCLSRISIYKLSRQSTGLMSDLGGQGTQ